MCAINKQLLGEIEVYIVYIVSFSVVSGGFFVCLLFVCFTLEDLEVRNGEEEVNDYC